MDIKSLNPERLESLYETTIRLFKANQPDDIIKIARSFLDQLIPFEQCLYIGYDPLESKCILSAEENQSYGSLSLDTFTEEVEGVCTTQKQKSLKTDENHYVIMPLVSNQTCVGVFALEFKNEPTLTEEQSLLLQECCQHVASSLENVQAYLSVRKLAVKDPLTKVFNRRFLHVILPTEFNRAKLQQVELTFILFDIDHFKNINDQFGHLVGDKILVEFAKMLSWMFRKTDVIVRFGGEEFGALMAGCSEKDAESMVENVRSTMANIKFSIVQKHHARYLIREEQGSCEIFSLPLPNIEPNPDLKIEESRDVLRLLREDPKKLEALGWSVDPFKVTISAGVSSFPDSFKLSSDSKVLQEEKAIGEDDLLLYMADKALYKAKQTGRNKVICYSDIKKNH